MDLFEQNQNALHQDMDIISDRMNQLLETLRVVIKGQEELRQNVAKLSIATTPSSFTNGGHVTMDEFQREQELLRKEVN